MNILFEYYYVTIGSTKKFTFSEFMRYISPFRYDETFDVYVHLVSPDKKIVFRLFLKKDDFEDHEVMLNCYFALFHRIKKLEDDLLISSITSDSITSQSRPITLFVIRCKKNNLNEVDDSQEVEVKIEYKQYNYFQD